MTCDICGGPIRSDNASGVCKRSEECLRENQKRSRDRRGQSIREGRARWYRENQALVRDNRIRRMYGITQADFEAMLERQEYGCAVCGEEPEGNGVYSKWRIDHNHATGKVREILCAHCNLALGHAKDSPKRLRALAVYIEAHGSD